MKKNLVLLGMMGVGKTTLGKIIAEKQGKKFIDIDANIESRNLMTINEIFRRKGENFFRKEEEKEVLKCLKKDNCVIALGGGAFVNSKIRDVVLKIAVSFWLDIDVKIIKQRVKRTQKRPLLEKNNVQKTIEDLLLKRKNFYKLADHKIICDKLNKEDITNKIIDLYKNH